METCFAPAERVVASKLLRDIKIIADNPAIGALLRNNNCLIAVLNEQRQILAINDGLLHHLQETDPASIVGKRLGEAIGCIHAHDAEGGCGTGEFCSSCGIATAVVSALANNEPLERNCAVTVEKNNTLSDLFLKTSCSTMLIDHTRFLLLFMHDITLFQKWAAMERTFFHEITNIAAALLSASELIMDLKSPPPLALNIHKLAKRLAKEIEMQHCLLSITPEQIRLKLEPVHLESIIMEIKSMSCMHSASMNKRIHFPPSVPQISFSTDLSLLLRVLYNMVVNALEATEDGGDIKLAVEKDSSSLSFSVWNRSMIPPDISKRIFQRYVSSKTGHGRGLGTYSMKLFGEELLGGKVTFMTSEKSGTTFTYIMAL
ncbi:MAG: hypothetical protein JXA71_11025 [Chitinispirillaceae bacterium]|nr:hypothetical protein [Chitinispirillaceae bacterium]